MEEEVSDGELEAEIENFLENEFESLDEVSQRAR